ncbi:uncharacterized protein PpBr36_09805 [Pyricularia pennisetigena]|uniref:uncharacterized protein n=1 Tax=Pyricularia pennisetigena TaxID=1578925 RepID=UPI001151E744|nr:uncharacterized protein PpBr36_09805 [Pyricularia pennisetigena]TLS22432.1 hypothetical protein PpBr36_09805 [Pyricularia pennisetigena]
MALLWPEASAAPLGTDKRTLQTPSTESSEQSRPINMATSRLDMVVGKSRAAMQTATLSPEGPLLRRSLPAASACVPCQRTRILPLCSTSAEPAQSDRSARHRRWIAASATERSAARLVAVLASSGAIHTPHLMLPWILEWAETVGRMRTRRRTSEVIRALACLSNILRR